ncbi:DUF2171 domain-containing protein [Salmonella enterica subsp. enterica]|mgnify:FL=1|jgi:hypothetical protein|uniref:DUF2171 domain-containing protein n=1 Tax=Nitratireductor rhodophyticola TaxID=2854036 RepID=UPI000F92E58A|nr:DUF2171 domain-containing protein [Salmonella enterica subsp. enterica]EBW2353275.1 DUF2171 domain-containing protein [Salmonella enterica subsp. enterica serovar Enteritidis]EBX4816717.1 hypothetical protein [Salmonella enterica subsp. enterica serovar Newport]ECI7685916.1 DUF2171 domain-containing protein [Salmonella enterica subsp. enterica serovar Paratyphi A]EFG4742040.1 DUF2171 domain-containing protein [Escherichia coli]
MSNLADVKRGMTVLGADGAPVGKVAAVTGGRIALEPAGSGHHAKHKHYVPGGLVALVENNVVRLSATGANAVLFDEESDGSSAD